MMYLELFLSFIKIGLVAFGGGYAMIPLIQAEVVSHNYLTNQEFIDILAVSEMTPGPIAINMATFTGFRIGGVPGSIVATLGVVLPSLVLIILLGSLLWKLRSHNQVKGFFWGLKASITALILAAGLLVGQTAWKEALDFSRSHIFIGLGIGLGVLLALKLKWNPVFLIFASGIVGLLFLR